MRSWWNTGISSLPSKLLSLVRAQSETSLQLTMWGIQVMLQLQMIKVIVNSHRFKSSRSDESRRMQVLDLENDGIYPTLIY